MRMSQLFGQTLREAPADAEVASHQLLVRSGFIRQLGAGIYTLMPMGKRVTEKIETIMRQEMNAIGGQEVFMPVVHPADLWKETNRWYEIGDEMSRFQDKNGRDMVLAMTHEEVVADLVRKDIQSYRQLPRLIYHLQTKWRDDPRPRAGLIRVREFTMKDSYSLDMNEKGLDTQYRAHYQAYFDIFNRCGLPVVAVLSDVGMMGGSMAHEYMYLTDIGEDTLLLCDACGYMANRQIARFRKPMPSVKATQEMEKVATPGVKTIEGLAQYLKIDASQTAKAVFMMATFLEDGVDIQRLVFSVVRGDMDLNETKLANVLKSKELRAAQDVEITAVGAVAGYASPVGLDPEKMVVVVDDLVKESANLVAGANEEGYHLRNVNYGRDYEAHIIADISAADAGNACVNCGERLRTSRGVEVGNIFKLGTKYTDALGAKFLDKDGEEQPVIMGSYGIGSGRLLQCIVEEHHDERGIIWPITVAPYHIHIVALRGGDEVAARIYTEISQLGVETLYDDREESPGVKFNDADLIGIPIRVTVSERGLKECQVEVKLRHEEEKRLVQVDDVISQLINAKHDLEVEIAARIKPVKMDF